MVWHISNTTLSYNKKQNYHFFLLDGKLVPEFSRKLRFCLAKNCFLYCDWILTGVELKFVRPEMLVKEAYIWFTWPNYVSLSLHSI